MFALQFLHFTIAKSIKSHYTVGQNLKKAGVTLPKGIVFDIQKFSLHDGPGIRTTVFLKGCPLSCWWCCNPESQKLEPQLAFIEKNCQHCLSCVAVCPSNVHFVKDDKHNLQFDLCSHCGDCLAVCPHNALKMYGKEMSVDDVMKSVLQDRPYYVKSGGGMTLSGGDPTTQFDFSLALLQAAKRNSIHTCLETAGYVTAEKMEQLCPVVDTFLFDFKLYDDNLSRKYIGVSTNRILSNLELLNQCGATLILRCPIVPGINDTTAHFSKIVELTRLFKNITAVHILAYHDFGRNKAANIGAVYPILEKAASESDASGWIQQLRNLGCISVKRG